ncbi:calymmin [Corythoichthys intestinalis]|uniref:calymmin n=1 Tax=Corythoichthys intestinalis TaxID=161448 RepID=UPI0025A59C6F|nr:calymmin [Corythoichthys intestinalis]
MTILVVSSLDVVVCNASEARVLCRGQVCERSEVTKRTDAMQSSSVTVQTSSLCSSNFPLSVNALNCSLDMSVPTVLVSNMGGHLVLESVLILWLQPCQCCPPAAYSAFCAAAADQRRPSFAGGSRLNLTRPCELVREWFYGLCTVAALTDEIASKGGEGGMCQYDIMTDTVLVCLESPMAREHTLTDMVIKLFPATNIQSKAMATDLTVARYGGPAAGPQSGNKGPMKGYGPATGALGGNGVKPIGYGPATGALGGNGVKPIGYGRNGHANKGYGYGAKAGVPNGAGNNGLGGAGRKPMKPYGNYGSGPGMSAFRGQGAPQLARNQGKGYGNNGYGTQPMGGFHGGYGSAGMGLGPRYGNGGMKGPKPAYNVAGAGVPNRQGPVPNGYGYPNGGTNYPVKAGYGNIPNGIGVKPNGYGANRGGYGPAPLPNGYGAKPIGYGAGAGGTKGYGATPNGPGNGAPLGGSGNKHGGYGAGGLGPGSLPQNTKGVGPAPPGQGIGGFPGIPNPAPNSENGGGASIPKGQGGKAGKPDCVPGGPNGQWMKVPRPAYNAGAGPEGANTKGYGAGGYAGPLNGYGAGTGQPNAGQTQQPIYRQGAYLGGNGYVKGNANTDPGQGVPTPDAKSGGGMKVPYNGVPTGIDGAGQPEPQPAGLSPNGKQGPVYGGMEGLPYSGPAGPGPEKANAKYGIGGLQFGGNPQTGNYGYGAYGPTADGKAGKYGGANPGGVPGQYGYGGGYPNIGHLLGLGSNGLMAGKYGYGRMPHEVQPVGFVPQLKSPGAGPYGPVALPYQQGPLGFGPNANYGADGSYGPQSPGDEGKLQSSSESRADSPYESRPDVAQNANDNVGYISGSKLQPEVISLPSAPTPAPMDPAFTPPGADQLQSDAASDSDTSPAPERTARQLHLPQHLKLHFNPQGSKNSKYNLNGFFGNSGYQGNDSF